MPSPNIPPTANRPRRGWRERVEAGLYRAHRVACPASAQRTPDIDCACPWELAVPNDAGATTSVHTHGTLQQARQQRQQLLAEPPASRRTRQEAAEAAAAAAQTLHQHVARVFRTHEQLVSPRTVMNWDHTYRAWILTPLGQRPLREIDRAEMDEWFADVLARAPSRRAAEKALFTLRRFLRQAVEWNLLDANPAAGMRMPRRDPHDTVAERRVLSADQVAHLLADPLLTLRIETLLRAAIEGCLRSGELSGLRWADVDLARGQLRLRRQVFWDRLGRRYLVGGLKGRRSRTVKISPTFQARLAAWYQLSVVDQGADADGYVWPGRQLPHLAEGSAAQAVERCLARRGLLDADGKPLVTLHGLRHTGASLLFAQNVPMLTISRHLGHQSPQVTATIYAHLVDDKQLDRVADAFEAMQAPAPAPPGRRDSRTRQQLRTRRRTTSRAA